MKIITALILFFTLTSTGFAATKTEAWWMTVDLMPEDMTLNGLTPEELNSSWAYASFLSFKDIKSAVTEEDYMAFINTSLSFAKVMDLDRNGKDDAVRVGVYRDQEANKGIFIAIFEEDQLVQVLAEKTGQGFSALMVRQGELFWVKCIECNQYEKLLWNGTAYVLE